MSVPVPIQRVRDLAALLEVRREVGPLHAPALTLANGGGDWEDVALLLAVEAKQAGLRTKIQIAGAVEGHDYLVKIQLMAAEDDGGEAWYEIGEPGTIPRHAV